MVNWPRVLIASSSKVLSASSSSFSTGCPFCPSKMHLMVTRNILELPEPIWGPGTNLLGLHGISNVHYRRPITCMNLVPKCVWAASIFFFRLRADNDKRNSAALLYCPDVGPLANIMSSTKDMYIDEKRFGRVP